MSLEALLDNIGSIPAKLDPIMDRLWNKSKITYNGKSGCYDDFDILSSRIACTALQKKKRVLIVFPDQVSRRPSLVFSSSLIWYWFLLNSQAKQNFQLSNNILYFGSSVEIRKQLSMIGISGLDINLKRAFKQVDLKKQDTNVRYKIIPNSYQYATKPPEVKHDLPSVVTAFAPIDPIKLVKEQKPDWIAIELTDSPRNDWIEPLMKEAQRRNLAVIAWCNNPLAKTIECFHDFGRVFIWPTLSKSIEKEDNKTDLHLAFYPDQTTELRPLIIHGESSDFISKNLKSASISLFNLTQICNDRFGRDTVGVLYRYLRALESVYVPISIHEMEAERNWGNIPLKRLRETCNLFIEHTPNNSPLQASLVNCLSCLTGVHDFYLSNESPLWKIVSLYCIEEPPQGRFRIIVFPSETKKRTTLLGLLAYWNISEDDLKEMRVFFTSSKNLNALINSKEIRALRDSIEPHTHEIESNDYSVCDPIFIGLPNRNNLSHLIDLLKFTTVDFIMYKHQFSLFKARATIVENKINTDLAGLIDCIGYIAEHSIIKSSEYLPIRIKQTPPFSIHVETAKTNTINTNDTELYIPNNQLEEIEILFASYDSDNDQDLGLSNINGTTEYEHNENDKEITCSKAIEINFIEGWRVLFAYDDTINIVLKNGNQRCIEQRYVRSLRTGDEVILIHGQRKQSLYNLIVSRVHTNPEIQLTVALINKWQSEFSERFNRIYTGDSRFTEFLQAIQSKGSVISSEAAIRSWHKGCVLCPQDAQDLVRISEVLDIQFIKSNAKYIENAATRLRGLHHSLSMKLSSWLTNQALGNMNKDDDDIIDEKLGLYFSDIRDSIYRLTVSNMTEIDGLFLKNTLGFIVKEI